LGLQEINSKYGAFGNTIILTTYINSLAHIVDCEESNLDYSEKPSKNNKLRKRKLKEPNSV
jgi:hypothetical protein